MKRFFIISLLAMLSVPAARACIWEETHNYYLFSVCESEEFKYRVDRISRDNWRVYLGMPEGDSFYFDADVVVKGAEQKNDALMARYARQLERYLQCVRSKEREQYEWNYPTADEIAQRNATLHELRTYAKSQLTSRLRSQHALLFMRCNMMLGQHSENVSFWEQTASKYIETVYKEMMQNIYAGALLKTGRTDEAGQIFAAQGDWQSLMTQYYLKRSFEAIRQEYLRNPQSAVLPFLLQDFVNNAQEATDADNPLAGATDGKLFVRDIQRQEAQQMIQLAAKAATEGKTQWPILWMSAKAWLEFLYGNKMQALADIRRAINLEGTQRMKDNARVLLFYITAMQTTPSDSFVTTELQWLNTMQHDDGHYAAALDRIIHQALFPMYSDADRQETALALLAVSHFNVADRLDVMPLDGLLSYLDYAKSAAHNALDSYLKPQISIDQTAMIDLVGTKYLRLCQWKEAQQWLQQVPLSFYQQQGYAPYAAVRSYGIEPWSKRQWLPDSVAYGDNAPRLTENPKLKFAREMQQLEAGLDRLRGKAYEQRCLALAIRYAQASFTGDCWFLMRDGKSAYDEVRPNEVDLGAKAVSLLQKASQSSDRQVKERALFGLCYIYLNTDTWFESRWNSERSDYDRHLLPQTQHYRNWAALLNYERQAGGQVPDYISRCDEYRQFKKLFRP